MLNRITKSAALIGNLTYAGGQMVLVLLLAHFAGLAELGLFTLALAISAPIQLGFGMSLRSVRVVEDPSAFPFRLFLRQAVLSSILALVVASGLAIAVFSSPEERWTIVAVAIMKAIESLIELTYGEMQRLARLDLVALSQVGRTALLIAVAVMVLTTGGGATALALSMAGTWAFVLMVIQFPVARLLWRRSESPRSTTSRGDAGDLLRKCWPMGFAAAAISLNGSLPRLVTYGWLGPEEAGALAILTYPIAVMSIIGNSLGQTILLSMREARDRRDFRSASGLARRPQRQVAVIGVALVAAILMGGRPVLSAVLPGYTGETIAPAVAFAVAATIAGLASIAYYELMSTGRYASQLILSLFVMGAALPLLLLGVRGGLLGVGVAMCLYLAIQWRLAVVAARGGGARQGRGPTL